MAYNTVTITTTATLIIAANTNRIGLILVNTSAGTVYLADNNSVTTSNGIPLRENENLTEDSGGTKMFPGDIYGIVGSGTADVRYWERTRQS